MTAHFTLGQHPKMDECLDTLQSIYEGLGAQVTRLPSKTTDSVFHRDVGAWTPVGHIKCCMAKRSRQWEPDMWFDSMGITPALTIEPPATFEGADLIWTSGSQAAIACGRRTNRRGQQCVTDFLTAHGLSVIQLELPWWHNQHLLGVANQINGQIVSTQNYVDPRIKNCLPQWDYVRKGPNWVQVGDVIVMPQNTKTKRVVSQLWAGQVVSTDIKQILKFGGGVACATGVVTI